MKKSMLLASWIFIAFIQASFAQKGAFTVMPESTVFNDTIVVNLKGNNKVMFIGSSLKEMVNSTRLDSVKLLFMNDISSAWKNKSLAEDSKRVFYFISKEGKRRLKAEAVEYSDNSLDVAQEIKRLKLDLPAYEYHIYDLGSEEKIEVYLSNPQDIQELGAVSLDAVLSHAKSSGRKELRQNYLMQVSTENEIKITDKKRTKFDYIEANPVLGVGLIGNTLAPVIGADLWLKLSDKYSIPKYKFGVGVNSYCFVNATSTEIKNVSFLNSYDLRVAVNPSRSRDKAYWLGFQGGLIRKEGELPYGRGYKFGIFHETGMINYSIDMMSNPGKSGPIYGLTVKLPF